MRIMFLSNVTQWWEYLISETSAKKKSMLGSEKAFFFFSIKPINSPGDKFQNGVGAKPTQAADHNIKKEKWGKEKRKSKDNSQQSFVRCKV